MISSRARAAALAITLLLAARLRADAQSIILRPGAGGRTQVASGSKVTVPVVIDMTQASPLDVAALRSALTWNSGALTLDSIRPATSGTLTSSFANTGASSSATLDLSTPSIVSTTTMANLYFTAANANGASTTLSFAPSLATDGANTNILAHVKTLDLDVCVAPSGKWGDATGDLSVNILDAQQIARYSVGLSVGNLALTVNQSDVNADNNVNILDAQQVARFSVGLSASSRINTNAFTPPTAATIAFSAMRVAINGAIVPGSSANVSALNAGDQVQLRPLAQTGQGLDVSSCASIVYATTNSAVATVTANGLVTAVSAGTTIITAVTGLQIASVTVTVGLPGGIYAKAGTGLSVDPVGAAAPSVQPVFVARTLAGIATPGVPVLLTIDGRCQFDLGAGQTSNVIGLTTDPQGEVRPPVLLPNGPDGAGCTIFGGTTDSRFPATDSSLVAVYPTGTTHVWTGLGSTWSATASWVRPGTTPAVPASASDDVFIPWYTSQMAYPQATTNLAVHRLSLDTGAVLFMNNNRIDVGTGGVTGFGNVISGTTRMVGSSTVAGFFTQLDIGQTGSCGGASPMTVTIAYALATTVQVYCKTTISFYLNTSNLTVNPSSGQGWLTVPALSQLTVNGPMNIVGDRFDVQGDVFVTGAAVLGGQLVTGGGNVGGMSLQGSAVFNAVSANYFDASIVVGGDLTVGGGNAGMQQFSIGTLQVKGNFTQLPGAVTNTFVTSGDNFVFFNGTSPQTITMTNPANNPFTVIQLFNSSSTGVTLASDMVVAQTPQSTFARIIMNNSKLTVPVGKVLTMNGSNIALAPTSVFTVNGTVTLTNGGVCSGRTNGATVTGTGTINGQAPAQSCP